MPDIATRIGQYVQLRDLIKQKDEAHKSSMAPLRETLKELNEVILSALNAEGANSMSSPSGTAYKTEKKSASIENMEAFWSYVVSTEDWDMLDRKANVTAVEDYIKEHQAPPPGVNFSSRYEVGVRRS